VGPGFGPGPTVACLRRWWRLLIGMIGRFGLACPLKERALARVAPAGSTYGRYRAPNTVLAFPRQAPTRRHSQRRTGDLPVAVTGVLPRPRGHRVPGPAPHLTHLSPQVHGSRDGLRHLGNRRAGPGRKPVSPWRVWRRLVTHGERWEDIGFGSPTIADVVEGSLAALIGWAWLRRTKESARGRAGSRARSRAAAPPLVAPAHDADGRGLMMSAVVIVGRQRS